MRWALAGLLLACSGTPPPTTPRSFTAIHRCTVTGSAFGAVPLGTDVIVTELELDRVVRRRMTDCAEQQVWDVPSGPRSIARLGPDALAVTTAAGLTIAALAGPTQALALTPGPNGLHVGSDGFVYATTGATAPEAKLVKLGVDAGTPVLLGELALTGASAVTRMDASLVVARFTEAKLTQVDLALTPGTDLLACGDPFALTSFRRAGAPAPTLVTTCRSGGLELLNPDGARQRLPRDGTLYDTVADDFDRDGRIDLASVDPFGHELVLWWGAPDGGFEEPRARATDRGPILLRSADFDMDAGPELWVLAFQDRSVTVYRLEGTR